MNFVKSRFWGQIFRIFRCTSRMKSGLSDKFTNSTNNSNVAIFVRCLSKDGQLAILVAVCAYVMRRLAITHGFLQRISSNSMVSGYQFVTLLLCIPVSYLSNLFFKFGYALNQIRLSRIGLKIRDAKGEDGKPLYPHTRIKETEDSHAE